MPKHPLLYGMENIDVKHRQSDYTINFEMAKKWNKLLVLLMM